MQPIDTFLLLSSAFVLVASTIHVRRTYWKMSEHTLTALIATTLVCLLCLALGNVLLASAVLGWGYLIAWAMEYAHRPSLRRQGWEPMPGYARAVVR